MKAYRFDELTAATLAEVVTLQHERSQPAVWEDLARGGIGERERVALRLVAEKLVDYKSHRSNDATVWARAIYPLLALAERGDVRAFSLVTLSATFNQVELHGEADGALARNIDEEAGLSYLVVVQAKRGVAATDPMRQLLAAMLCAARLNEQDKRPGQEMFGCYTIADVWTFVRGTLDWTQAKPAMSLLSSREYAEKTEAATILAILGSIVARVEV